MSNTYFISDTHFHHKNILKYEPSRLWELAKYLGRDESDVLKDLKQGYEGDEEKLSYILNAHDRMLIGYWNATVGKEDVVWFLGDFVCGKKELAREIAASLNGRKRMVMGNHDNWKEEFYRSIGFECVSKYPVLLKGRFLLSHAPLAECPPPFFNVFGHIHLAHSGETETKRENHRCVCVERQGFKPIRIEEYDSGGYAGLARIGVEEKPHQGFPPMKKREVSLLSCRFTSDLFVYATKMRDCSSKVFIKAYAYSSLAKRISSPCFAYDCLDVPEAYSILKKEKKLSRGNDVYPSFVMAWIGYIMAYYSSYTGLPVNVFYSKVKPEELYRVYEAYHSLDSEQALKRLCEAKGLLLDFSGPEAKARIAKGML